jgi:8-oxo-dGTP pyrophosphatase MutT (NUDIX family)
MFPWRQEQVEVKPYRDIPAFNSLGRISTAIGTGPTPQTATIYGAIICTTNDINTRKYAIVQGRRSGKWSFPKGHANPGETPFECVVREVAEEIGCDKLPVAPAIGVPLHVGYYYVFPVEAEFTLNPRDTNEVETAGWFTVAEMRTMPVNVDISRFLARLTN